MDYKQIVERERIYPQESSVICLATLIRISIKLKTDL